MAHDEYGRPIVRCSLYTYGLKCLNKHCYCDSRKEHTLRKHAYVRRCWLDYHREKTAAARRRAPPPAPLPRPTVFRHDSGYDGVPRGATLRPIHVAYRTLPTPAQKASARTVSSDWLSILKKPFRALKESACDSLYLYLIKWACCIDTSLPSKIRTSTDYSETQACLVNLRLLISDYQAEVWEEYQKMGRVLLLHQQKPSSPRSSEQRQSDEQEIEAAQKNYDWFVMRANLAKRLRNEAEKRVEDWESKNSIQKPPTFQDEDDVALMFGLESTQ